MRGIHYIRRARINDGKKNLLWREYIDLSVNVAQGVLNQPLHTLPIQLTIARTSSSERTRSFLPPSFCHSQTRQISPCFGWTHRYLQRPCSLTTLTNHAPAMRALRLHQTDRTRRLTTINTQMFLIRLHYHLPIKAKKAGATILQPPVSKYAEAVKANS